MNGQRSYEKNTHPNTISIKEAKKQTPPPSLEN